MTSTAQLGTVSANRYASFSPEASATSRRNKVLPVPLLSVKIRGVCSGTLKKPLPIITRWEHKPNYRHYIRQNSRMISLNICFLYFKMLLLYKFHVSDKTKSRALLRRILLVYLVFYQGYKYLNTNSTKFQTNRYKTRQITVGIWEFKRITLSFNTNILVVMILNFAYTIQ